MFLYLKQLKKSFKTKQILKYSKANGFSGLKGPYIKYFEEERRLEYASA